MFQQYIYWHWPIVSTCRLKGLCLNQVYVYHYYALVLNYVHFGLELLLLYNYYFCSNNHYYYCSHDAYSVYSNHHTYNVSLLLVRLTRWNSIYTSFPQSLGYSYPIYIMVSFMDNSFDCSIFEGMQYIIQSDYILYIV